MIARLRSQDGVTLIELLVAMVLMVFVFGITITTFVALQDDHRRTNLHNEAAEEARITIDRMARELRNLASPTVLRNVKETRPRAVELAQPFDLVFRMVDEGKPSGTQNDANVRRMRYCLDARDPLNQRLFAQVQRWSTATAPAAPATDSCPGSGWEETRAVSEHIVNISPNGARPLFTYDSSNLEEITRVRSEVFVDPTPNTGPREARLASGVLLRNQNRFPKASFAVTVTGTTTIDGVTYRNLSLDASSSTDPEGQTLSYCWFANPPVPTPECPTPAKPTVPAGYIGEGVVLGYRVKAGQPYRFVLRIEDPAGLRDEVQGGGTY